jgi:hypothetical protein
VEAPFRKASDQTLFLRPSWSADGAVLCGVHGVKSRKPVAVGREQEAGQPLCVSLVCVFT